MTTYRRSIALALALSAAALGASAATYDEVIKADRPVMFLGMDTPSAGTQADLSGSGNNGAYKGGTPALQTLPNGERAAEFNGAGQYLSVPSAPALSVPTTKKLTVEAWMKPSVLNFPNTEAEDYVYWMGKGNPTQGYEYANRMYSYNNSAGRPNRISVYHWNKSGGLGSGAYFQDPVSTSQWIHVVDVFDMTTGYISIYKNGVLRGKVPFSQYNVTPTATSSPFNVGTRNYNSWFKGAIGKVAVYNYVLSQTQITNHVAAMSGGGTVSNPPPATATAPSISGVQATSLTTSGATVIWNTDKVSHSQVEYGLSTSYGSSSPLSTATGLAHSIALTGLKAGTMYHYRVKSKDDATGLTGVSGDFTFMTTAPPAPVITNVTAVPSNTGVSVSWTTDRISHSQVEYGATASYGKLSYQSTATGLQHNVVVSNLTAGTAYHYRVLSKDDATGLTGVSGDFAFTTTGAIAGGGTSTGTGTGTSTGTGVISAVTATNITTSGANITWNTTTVSHSQVEYGLTASYGSKSYQSTATGTSHWIPLSGLKAGTTYHYRVLSLDSKGNTAVSGDFTFTTKTGAAG
ncbi:MAG: fibronectin type III domain-containing protein [Elusimicrobia bacterium]|nr:fibronectin type III domain-containing protein [Elusimicrobiota bacterium]